MRDAKADSFGIVLYLGRDSCLGVGLSGLRHVGKILLYGILFNLVLVGIPFVIEGLKADTHTWLVTDQMKVDMHAMFAKNPPVVDWRDPVLIYALLLGWIAVCGFFVQEAKEIG